MTQIFAAFSSPNEPFIVAGMTLLAEGVPYYFPGAPFVFSALLEGCALVMLFFAFRRIVRPGKQRQRQPRRPRQWPSNRETFCRRRTCLVSCPASSFWSSWQPSP